MPTIHELKEQAITETPLVLFHCVLPDGTGQRWSTHEVSFAGHAYSARVLRHNVFEMKWGAEDGIDSVTRVALSLINADSNFSQITQSPGWKGARLTATFVFFDLAAGTAASEPLVLFRGLLNPPDEVTETVIRLSAANRLNPQRMMLPEVRIQRRCPWSFPSNGAQRAEAVDGGARGKYSPFHRCGYSADQPGGLGNMNGSSPFTSCDYSRASCEQRGMFNTDSSSRPTRRFGGVEYVPASSLVRTHGDRDYKNSAIAENEARYNDYIPVVYGTAWLNPPVVFAKNDGNLTRMQVLLSAGEINRVIKVVVNGIEIPLGITGSDMTATGWFTPVGMGSAQGAIDPNFAAGDPYGGVAALSIVVPNRVSDSRSLPKVAVLLEGLKMQTFATDGSYIAEVFTNNPAWVMLDLLRRAGWAIDEIDTASFATAAAHCATLVTATDLNGNAVQVPRFQCNLVMRRRRSVADWIRGVRNNARLFLAYSAAGLLQLRTEGSFAQQQPVKPAGSNATLQTGGGWAAYEFGDGSGGLSGIARRPNGASSVRMWSRGTFDTPNRVSTEFQDEFNEYQQDSLSLVDVDDAELSRQELSVTSTALGIANFHQAARVLKLQIDKSVRGNLYIEFETSVRGVMLRPGDLITVTYQKEGLVRRPFRVTRIVPATNFGTIQIEAQLHSDAWYGDTASIRGTGDRRDSGEIGVPRPLLGSSIDSNGDEQFDVTETAEEAGDGTPEVALSVSFTPPARPAAAALSVPRISLTASVNTSGGTIAGDQILYYSVTAVDSNGAETLPSFVVRAAIPAGSNVNRITLSGLSFSPATASFHVYRGRNPWQMYRIAENVTLASSFTDTGAAAILAGLPDDNFDHAQFDWRLELHPETGATIFSTSTIGAASLTLTPDEYAGMIVRITRGKGAGQERAIESHTATIITAASPWSTAPDATSFFAIAESGWHPGAESKTSPVRFRAPNRPGATVQIVGRAVNALGRDSGFELAPVTRWNIGGSTGSLIDTDVPPAPSFALEPKPQGTVSLVGVGFPALDNTHTVQAATLRLFYWDELLSPSSVEISGALSSGTTSVTVSTPSAAQPGDLIQVDGEVMEVETVSGSTLQVLRGSHGTAPASHAAGEKAYRLDSKTYVVPFARDFFGSPASGSFAYPIFLPDARIAAAEMFVTNSRGNSETAKANFTGTTDAGIRTVSGGLISIQVEGYLAIQTSAAPPLVIDEAHSVRDIFAVVQDAPAGAPVQLAVKVNGTLYCSLTIAAGNTVSNTVSGFGLTPLQSMDEITLDIVSVGSTAATTPGRDLTVTIRL